MRNIKDKYLIILIFFLGSIHPYLMNAQKEVYKELLHDNGNLAISIKNLTEEINKLNEDSLRYYNNQIFELDNIINKRNHEISSLKDSISNEFISKLKNEVESLNKEILETHKEIEAKDIELKDNNREIDKMRPYNKIRQENLYQKYYNLLLSGFSTIDDETLNKIYSTVNDFSSMDNFDEYRARIEYFKNCISLYKESQDALESPLNEQNIRKLRIDIQKKLYNENDSLKNNQFKLSPKQFKEFDNLDIKLSRYKNGILKLKEIVNTINSDTDIKSFRSKKNDKVNCIKKIDGIIKMINENGDIIKRYFKEITYLGNLFKKYYEELKENPFNQTSIEKTIIQL